MTHLFHHTNNLVRHDAPYDKPGTYFGTIPMMTRHELEWLNLLFEQGNYSAMFSFAGIYVVCRVRNSGPYDCETAR